MGWVGGGPPNFFPAKMTVNGHNQMGQITPTRSGSSSVFLLFFYRSRKRGAAEISRESSNPAYSLPGENALL